MMEIDLRQLDFGVLATRIFRQASAATAELDLLRDEGLAPDEAWESMASRDLIPMEWVGAPHRLFVHSRPCEACGGRAGRANCAQCMGRGSIDALKQEPSSIALCASLANDPAAVLYAEKLGLELVHRLRLWSAPPLTRVAWKIIDPDVWRHRDESPLGRVLDTAGTAAQTMVTLTARAGAIANSAFRALAFSYWGLPLERDSRYGVSSVLERAVCWENAAALELSVPDGATYPESARRTKFTTAGNPFTPLLFLWSSGVAYDRQLDDALVLVITPPPGWSVPESQG